MSNLVNIKDKANLKDMCEFVFINQTCIYPIRFRTYTIPDQLIITSPTQGTLLDTGLISTGSNFITYNIVIPDDAVISVNAPNEYTAWDLILCDGQDPVLNQSGGQNINGQPHSWIYAELIYIYP
jgi:hypothetical protein